MTARARIVFTLCLMSLGAIALSLFAASAGPSGRDGPSRDAQIDALEKQVQDLSRQLEVKKESPRAAPEVEPRPKHAVLNLTYVIRKYKKWAELQDEYKKELASYDEELNKLKDEYERTEAAAKTSTDRGVKEKLAKDKRELRNQMSDKIEAAKKALADLEANHFSEIYKDIQSASERYAKAHELEMVSHFKDGTTEAEINSPISIGRKMNQDGLFPLYIGPGLDISKEVLALLNGEKDGEQD
jgi:Skp family chaperone for outer membrane proteins